MSSELRFEAGEVSAILELRRSARARQTRLKVDPRTGAVVLSIPKRASARRALAWAEGQRDWVEAALARITRAEPIVPGCTIQLLGVGHRLEWDAAWPRTPRVDGDVIRVGGPRDGLEARVLRWLKREALALLDADTREYAAKAGVSVTRVGVGDPVSRWGSCAWSGAIRYSWRLLLTPDWVRRATVAHEVAHRVHMNHGPEFHALVETLFGDDPTPARLWLRRNGAALHRLGRR